MFSKGVSWVEILIPRGVWGVERKKFSRLAIARHDPPCNTPLIFTLDVGLTQYAYKKWKKATFHCRLPSSWTQMEIIADMTGYRVGPQAGNLTPCLNRNHFTEEYTFQYGLKYCNRTLTTSCHHPTPAIRPRLLRAIRTTFPSSCKQQDVIKMSEKRCH